MVHVEVPSDQYLVRALGEQSFAPNWEFSYNYYDEDLNVAKVVYDEHMAGVWWQTHVRGWKMRRGLWQLDAHWELEPTENPSKHLDGEHLDVDRGKQKLKSALDDANIEIR